MGIAQPEMARTGITNFHRVGVLANAFHVGGAPHASIGIGIFLAASLQAAGALDRVTWHEYQHSIFDANRHLVTGDMDCRAGRYVVPTGPGLGVAPSEAALRLMA